MFHYLIYVSSATERLTTEELRDLLRECRRKNSAVGVSGALLYHEGTFLQVLEGDRNIVEAIYQKLEKDPRHDSIVKMISSNTEVRQFADWSMAFRDLTAENSDLAEGFSEFMLSQGTASYGDAPTVAQRVLLSFRDQLTSAP